MINDPLSLSIALLAVAFGSALQSLTGIGIAIVAAPILVLIDAAFLPAPILALGCALSLLNTLRYRQTLHFGNTRVALCGRIPGVLLGIPLLTLLPQSFLMIGFAVLIIISVALSYHHITLHQTRTNLAIAGFFSGVMGTTTSVGGPPIALVYQNSAPDQARAELGLYFLTGTLMSLILLGFSGNITSTQVQLTLQMSPALLAGFFLSFWLDRYFKVSHLKPVIALMSLSSSAVILCRTLAQL